MPTDMTMESNTSAETLRLMAALDPRYVSYETPPEARKKPTAEATLRRGREGVRRRDVCDPVKHRSRPYRRGLRLQPTDSGASARGYRR